MTMLRRIIVEKRHLVLPLIVALVANLVAAALLVYPLGARVARGEERARVAAQALAGAERQLESAMMSVAEAETAEVALRRFYVEVLPENQSSARRLTHLDLAQMAAGHGLQFERRLVVEEQERDSALVRMDTTMILLGDYNDVRRFVHALETSPGFVVIRRVELSQQSEPGAPLLLTLEVSTYYRTEDV